MKKVEKIHMLNEYLAKYYSMDPRVSKELGLGEEFANVLAFHSEEEWRQLDDYSKADLLKASLSLNRKTGPDGNYSYAIKLIEFFDELLITLDRVNTLTYAYPSPSDVDFDLLRVYAVLNIEKWYFDETAPPANHLRPYFFENLATQFSSKYPDLNLGLLAVLHKAMYNTWPEKSLHDQNNSK